MKTTKHETLTFSSFMRFILLLCLISVMVFGVITICSKSKTQNTVSAKATEASQVTAITKVTTVTTSKHIPITKSILLKPELNAEYKCLGEFTLTAYCPCVECCGEWSKDHPSRIGTDYIQRTITGTIPKQGRTIGVDPDVIPYGSVVVIDGHEYMAEDTGGLIEGNHIDIYFDNHTDALKFGLQTEKVYIKETK